MVWLPHHGLGNKMISITSAFLYSLLKDKVLLLFFPDYMNDLFYESFPNTTWLLPSDFPITHVTSIFDKDPNRYGNLLRDKILSNDMNITNASIPLLAYLYLHLVHNNNDYDRMFYCEDGQLLLQQFPWLLLRSNQYFIPALFLIPMFEQELGLLFPERTTVFHLLGRYLFHPSNAVWGYVTRYYQAYLANAEEILGVQIRTFAEVDLDKHSSYIMNCAISKNLLPSLDTKDVAALSDTIRVKPKAVLVTSLKSEYFERIRDTYYRNATATGEVIGVYQPSHEEKQFTEKLDHNVKALAEIYLLSLSDSLIMSQYSTFGYVAQGLGGIRPWLLVRPDDENLCLQSSTMEPCFHFPPSFECKSRRELDLGSVVPYLRHCEDKAGGIKLFY
ncbi:fucosyltransferase 2-like [Zingiber officinale]|uniref:fucosyltransferase 2-like n=1 Tax=Zingiber officinale TaxID=94328 RepID=UPI001C4D677C|nr:fucosyltransferase 2-like [Zingiber officinale]